MRKLVSAAVAAGAAALVLAGASHTAATITKTVKITSTAFSPATVNIATGDAVKWTNKDTKAHQVVANNGAFASPMLAAGHSYTHTFNTAGTFKYHDALHPALTGKIVVKGPPPDVTIGAAVPILTYGQSTSVAGQISSGQAGQTVTVYAQPYGQTSPILIATLLTGTNGAWSIGVKPLLLTAYLAHWKSTVSSTVSIAVHPHVGFTVSRRGVAAVLVKAGRSMQGRKVYIQRFTRFGEWIKIAAVRHLNARSGGTVRLRLAKGRYTLRAYMTINEAGAGYLDGTSRTIVVRRR